MNPDVGGNNESHVLNSLPVAALSLSDCAEARICRLWKNGLQMFDKII